MSAERARRRDSIEPLDADLRRLHLTVSRRFLDKLAAARDALSHSHPGAGTEDVLEAALDLVLAARAKRRGLVAKPRREKETAGGLTEASSGEGLPPAQRREREAIPAHVRREVWTRDAARCQWPLASGGICGSTHRLELDHLLPVARGGASTAENLRVLCRPHNLVAARAAFGKPWMDGFARGERGAGAGVWSGCVRRESGGAGSGAGADAIAPRVRRGVHAG